MRVSLKREVVHAADCDFRDSRGQPALTHRILRTPENRGSMTIDERIQFLVQSIESHDRQIGELTGAITKLVAVSTEDATAIRTLARICRGPRTADYSA